MLTKPVFLASLAMLNATFPVIFKHCEMLKNRVQNLLKCLKNEGLLGCNQGEGNHFDLYANPDREFDSNQYI